MGGGGTSTASNEHETPGLRDDVELNAPRASFHDGKHALHGTLERRWFHRGDRKKQRYLAEPTTTSVPVGKDRRWTWCITISTHKYRRAKNIVNENVNNDISLPMGSKREGRRRGRAPEVKNSDQCQKLDDAETTNADDEGIEKGRRLMKS